MNEVVEMKFFFEAIVNNDLTAVKDYLKRKSKININQSYEGKTALYFCCELGRENILKELINMLKKLFYCEQYQRNDGENHSQPLF